MSKMLKQALIISRLNFTIASRDLDNDVLKIGPKMVELGLDNEFDGFWIIDFTQDIEFYSPKFRETLGFVDENDFPNVPESWQKQIDPEGLKEAFRQLEEHIDAESMSPYYIPCTYNTKQGGKVDLICQGDIVDYTDDGKPWVMFGVHTIIQ